MVYSWVRGPGEVVVRRRPRSGKGPLRPRSRQSEVQVRSHESWSRRVHLGSWSGRVPGSEVLTRTLDPNFGLGCSGPWSYRGFCLSSGWGRGPVGGEVTVQPGTPGSEVRTEVSNSHVRRGSPDDTVQL